MTSADALAILPTEGAPVNSPGNFWMWVKRRREWLKWPVALLILGLLFWQNRESLEQLAERRIQWGYLTGGFLLCSGTIVLTFVRWYLLVWAQGFPFRLRDALRLGFIGFLFNYVGPGAAGGDLYKAVMIAKEQQSRRAAAVATVFLDRILGLVALFLVGSLAAWWQPGLLVSPVMQTVAAVFWFSAAAGTAGIAIALIPGVLNQPWMRRLERLPGLGRIAVSLLEALELYQAKPLVVLSAVGISICGHFGMLTSFYWCALAVNRADVIPGYVAHLLFIPAAELAAMAPIVPGGVGALEGAVAYFYQVAGAQFGDGFLTGLAYRAVTLLVGAIGGGYYLTARRQISAALASRPDN